MPSSTPHSTARKSPARKAAAEKSPARPAGRPASPSKPARKRTTARQSATSKRATQAPQSVPSAADPAKSPAAKTKTPDSTTTPPKGDKNKKPKLVRDSFTIPKAEYAVIESLKQRAAGLGRSPKKSEILRAGIMVLAAQSDAALIATLSAVPAIKTGRPKA